MFEGFGLVNLLFEVGFCLWVFGDCLGLFYVIVCVMILFVILVK